MKAKRSEEEIRARQVAGMRRQQNREAILSLLDQLLPLLLKRRKLLKKA